MHTVTVTLAGRSTTVRALRDSGNDLHDPVSGLPAAVVERAAVLPLFPALHALPDDAVQTLAVLGALPECTGRVVLLPYRAVGVTGALLPAFRPDSVMIDGAPEPMLLAPERAGTHIRRGIFHGAAAKKLRRGFVPRLLERLHTLWTALRLRLRGGAPGVFLHRRERHHARPARARGRAAGHPRAHRRGARTPRPCSSNTTCGWWCTSHAGLKTPASTSRI